MHCVYNLGYLCCLIKMAVTTESNRDWRGIHFFSLRNSLLFPYVFALPALEVIEVDDACV